MYLYLKRNVKWGTQNTKFKVINQHKSDKCHVQALENDFYLGAPSSFDRVFTPIGMWSVVDVKLWFHLMFVFLGLNFFNYRWIHKLKNYNVLNLFWT
jgi:hypothetical protein